MDRYPYILEEVMDRETLVKLDVINKVTDKDLYEEICKTEPMVAKLLLDSFKDFLQDDYFELVERQIALYKFLNNKYPLEVCRDLVSSITNTEKYNDYARIIMEWNYRESENLKKENLKQYDGSEFTMSKELYLKLLRYKQNHTEESNKIVYNLFSKILDLKNLPSDNEYKNDQPYILDVKLDEESAMPQFNNDDFKDDDDDDDEE